MKNVYKKLMKIKRPVLIHLEPKDRNGFLERFRILYPDGRCEYAVVDTGAGPEEFTSSCFALTEESDYTLHGTLKQTVYEMAKYDVDGLKIEKVEAI